MKFFLKVSVVYLAVVFLGQTVFGKTHVADPFSVVVSARSQFDAIRGNMTVIFLLLGLNLSMGGLPRLRRRYVQILLALVANVLFIAAFVVAKTNLTGIAGLWADPPFFADHFLAWLDRTIHFGVDPYRLAHAAMGWAGSRWADLTYGALWTTLTTLFPLIVAASDDDQRRIRDAMLLFVFAHVVLGNVVALAGMSAGPVYYDRLFGGDTFAGLTADLQSAGFAGSFIGNVQNGLWTSYSDKLLAAGSGISAFPSVHVATATMVAVYLASRSRWFIVPGVLYVAAILFISVLSGYHYAIDGYVAIIAVVLVWRWLRRRDPAGEAARAAPA